MAVDLSKLFGLKGKIAVITGASGAICGEMAESLAAWGVKTAILDINTEEAENKAAAIHKSGGTATVYHCSVLDEKRLKEVYKDILAKWGTPDFLINGAGGNHPSGSTSEKYLNPEDLNKESIKTFFDMEFEGFKNVLDLNFYGTLLPSKIFGAGMAKKGAGVIVNISSMSGITPLTKVAAYSAAKSAVINFTQWFAVHLANSGVRVNTIAPGFIMTEQSRFLQFDEKTGKMNERGREIIANTPLGRYGEPEELIGTLIWLLSDASKFVTGAVIPVDGGFSAYSI